MSLTGVICPWRSSEREIWCFPGLGVALWAGKAGSVSSTRCSYVTRTRFPLSVYNSGKTQHRTHSRKQAEQIAFSSSHRLF